MRMSVPCKKKKKKIKKSRAEQKKWKGVSFYGLDLFLYCLFLNSFCFLTDRVAVVMVKAPGCAVWYFEISPSPPNRSLADQTGIDNLTLGLEIRPSDAPVLVTPLEPSTTVGLFTVPAVQP